MRMHTIGERQVQIPKSLEEKSKSGSVYNRRFQGGDCRFQPSLNSPQADPNGPTCRFLENYTSCNLSEKNFADDKILKKTRGRLQMELRS